MEAIHVTTRSILSSFLPRLSASTATRTSRFTMLYSRQLSLPVLPSFGFAIPAAIQLTIPGLFEGLWESILRAVPKKKTSHMKKRHRQMAGKGLKDVTALNKCSACGNVKRAHLLCPYCVKEIQTGLFKSLNPDSKRSFAPGSPHTPTGKTTKTTSKETEAAKEVTTTTSKAPEDP